MNMDLDDEHVHYLPICIHVSGFRASCNQGLKIRGDHVGPTAAVFMVENSAYAADVRHVLIARRFLRPQISSIWLSFMTHVTPFNKFNK